MKQRVPVRTAIKGRLVYSIGQDNTKPTGLRRDALFDVFSTKRAAASRPGRGHFH